MSYGMPVCSNTSPFANRPKTGRLLLKAVIVLHVAGFGFGAICGMVTSNALRFPPQRQPVSLA